MTQPRAATEQENGQHRPKLRGRPWPKGVSGNPSGARMSKRFSVLFADLAADLGGEASLGALDRALLSQACSLMVRSERTKDNDAAVRLANASARLLAVLRNTKRRTSPASGSTLGDLLRQDRADQLAAAAGADDDGAAP